MELNSFGSFVEPANCPSQTVDHNSFVVSISRFDCGIGQRFQETVDEIEGVDNLEWSGDHHHWWILDSLFDSVAYLVSIEVLDEQSKQNLGFILSSFLLPKLAPTLVQCLITKIVCRNVDLSAAGHCSW